MKKLLLFALLLAGCGSPLAWAQCYRSYYGGGSSYVAPAPPPRTYTTYTYTAPSTSYKAYTPSYSAPSYVAPNYNSTTSGSDSGSSSSAPDTEARTRTSYIDEMTRNFNSEKWEGVLQAANVVEAMSRITIFEFLEHSRQLIIANNFLGRDAATVALYEKCRTLYADQPAKISRDAHCFAGYSYYAQGQYQLALDAYARDVKPSESDPFHAILCHFYLGDYGAALGLLESYPATYTRRSNFDYYLGFCQLYAPAATAALAQERCQLAVASLSRILAQNSKPGDAYRRRAEAYFRLGNYLLCIEDATRDLQRDHKSTWALYYRATAANELKQYPAALLDQSTLLDLDGSNAQYWNARAWTRCLSGDYAGGLADAREALRRDSTSAGAVNYLDTRGYARFGLGQYPAADEDYTRVVALNPASGLAYLMRGRTRLKLGQKALARADLQQAVKLGVSGHPTLKTADAQRLLAAPAGKAPAKARR